MDTHIFIRAVVVSHREGENYRMTRQRIVAVLAAALALGLSVGPVAALPAQDVGAADETSGTVTNLQAEGNTTITFGNQTSEGRNVTVQSVTLAEGGFVAIHTTELLNGSVLGSIVGSSTYLEPGEHENVTITLNESLDEEQTLIAIAYRDTNGNEEFDFVESRGQADGAYVIENQVVVDDAVVTPGPAAQPTEEPETTVAEPTEVVDTTEPVEETTEVETTEEVVEETTVAAEPTEEPPETIAETLTEVATMTEPEPTEETPTETTEEPLPEETPDGFGGALSPGQPGFGVFAALAGLAGGLYLLRRETDDR